ncbi:MAG: hypothetical protein CL626_09520 [Aurantimonas sp.]|nr:hypothetical protein [Aurantimonas sp.]
MRFDPGAGRVSGSSDDLADWERMMERPGATERRRRHVRPAVFSLILFILLAVSLLVVPASGQDMMRGLDLTSPRMTAAAMTRAEVEALLARATNAAPADLSRAELNGLDLSRLDLAGADLTSAYLNGTDLSNARLAGAKLDQAWGLGANFAGANLSGASLFQSQMQDATFDGADLSAARIAGDFSRASFVRANMSGADFSADMRNQSMGLMRGVLNSADLTGTDLSGANLSRAAAEFADFTDADLSGADLTRFEASGADFNGAMVEGADFADAELQSAKMDNIRGTAKNLRR